MDSTASGKRHDQMVAELVRSATAVITAFREGRNPTFHQLDALESALFPFALERAETKRSEKSAQRLDWNPGDRYRTEDGTIMEIREVNRGENGNYLTAADAGGQTHVFTLEGYAAGKCKGAHGDLEERLTGSIKDWQRTEVP